MHQLLAAEKEMFAAKQNQQQQQKIPNKEAPLDWHCLFLGSFAKADLFLRLVSDLDASGSSKLFWERFLNQVQNYKSSQNDELPSPLTLTQQFFSSSGATAVRFSSMPFQVHKALKSGSSPFNFEVSNADIE